MLRWAKNLVVKKHVYSVGLFAGIHYYFMLSGRISKNIGENIFWSYTGNTSENTDFDILVA